MHHDAASGGPYGLGTAAESIRTYQFSFFWPCLPERLRVTVPVTRSSERYVAFSFVMNVKPPRILHETHQA
jgi:hypothetical protein